MAQPDGADRDHHCSGRHRGRVAYNCARSGPGGYLPDFVRREPCAVAAASVRNITKLLEPEGNRDADLYKRLTDVVGEGLQVLEHESLIWVRNVSQVEVGYAPTRRGRAALEADAVEQTLSGESAETA